MFIVAGPVLIVGRARSGEAVANLLRHSYPQIDLKFFDDKKELSDFDSPRELLSKKWAHVIVSPGYPDKAWLKELQSNGAVLSQELDVAAAYLSSEKVYAITGSVGKSTCAWVTKETLVKVGKKVFLGGNFGVPLAEYALKKVQKNELADYVILELSSFQIERMAFMVDRALMLNFLPNHLDRYVDLHAYYESKLRLIQFAREGVWAIEPGGDLHDYAKYRSVDNKIKWVKAEQFEQVLKKSRLIGAHNRSNLAAVLEFLASPELDEQAVIDALLGVDALPHRIEVFEHNGISFVNDSKATTIEGVLTAYAALREKFENHKMFWLIGGKDKNLPWQKLKRLWSDRHLSFVFFGECAELAKNETGFEGPTFASLKEALKMVQGQILPGDVLVLSPAGTSFDEFKSFEHRGEFFKSTILSEF